MNRRRRMLAALLALIGFTAYLAESLAALACVPEMATHGAMAGEASTAAPHEGMHAGMHDAQAPAPSDSPAPPRPDAPPCPLGMAVGAAGCVALSLPGRVDAMTLATATRESAFRLADEGPDLLLAIPHFHPPRA